MEVKGELGIPVSWVCYVVVVIVVVSQIGEQ
jgi:hypothetical protein